MNAFLTIASREVTTRARVLIASLVIGLGSVVVPLLITTSVSPAEMRGASAWSAALLLGLGVAVLAGSALFGAPLAEGRTGFWLSRPASTTAIWAGKLSGAFALVALSSTVAILPGALTGTSPFGGASWPRVLRLDLEAALLFLLLAAAASVAIRSRSAWIAADLVLLCATAFLAWKAFETAAWVGAFDFAWLAAGPSVQLAIEVLALAIGACLAVGTWSAVAVGRGDIRLAHRAQTIALWTPLVALAAAAFGASLWYARPPVSALKVDWFETVGSDGTWVLTSGHAKNRPGGNFRFLVDSATGRSLRLDRSWWAAVSGDGSRAVTLRPASLKGREIEVVCIDLKFQGLRETVVPGSFPSSLDGIVLSADGSMLAMTGDGNLSVIELPSGRLLGSVALPRESGSRPEPVFRGTSVLILPQATFDAAKNAAAERPPELSVRSFDVRTRKLTAPVRLDVSPAPSGTRLVLSPDGTRLVARRLPSRSFPVDVLETATGRAAFRIAPSDGSRITASGFLADGSLFAVERTDVATRIRRFGADGLEKASILLPGGKVRFLAGAESRAGLVSGTLARENASGELAEDWSRLVAVDLVSGTVRETDDRARPVLGLGLGLGWSARSGDRIPPAGSPVTRVFQKGDTLVTGIPGEGPLVPLALH